MSVPYHSAYPSDSDHTKCSYCFEDIYTFTPGPYLKHYYHSFELDGVADLL